MSTHIDSVGISRLPALTKSEFYERIRPGDLLFCSGRESISRTIESLTDSPWSHVLMAWSPGNWARQWLTLEATFARGVHVGLLADYVDNYDGDIALARRPRLTESMIESSLARGFELLDDSYDWEQEASIACRKLCEALPLIQPRRQLYCSGLQYVMSLATPYPLQKPAASMPTPEDNWIDPTVETIGVLRT